MVLKAIGSKFFEYPSKGFYFSRSSIEDLYGEFQMLFFSVVKHNVIFPVVCDLLYSSFMVVSNVTYFYLI